MHLSVLVLSLLVATGSLAAGLLGSLTGLGGGIIVVPMLTLLFGVDLRYAIGASLVAVIATSSGAAAAYVREGFTNVRVGVFLELATTMGALAGASVAGLIPTHVLAALFGAVLLLTAYRSLRPLQERDPAAEPDRWAARLRMDSSYPVGGRMQRYAVQGVPTGFAIMLGAGVLSALLGIGSGIVKVVAMDRVMRLPFKVSTTTSNFMIGVTAAASSGVYLHDGYIDPSITFPVMLGVLAGALIGARLLPRARTTLLRRLFTVVLVVTAIKMLYNGITGAM
ncbi:MAG TPA: sulfite exporter TauE/SafE family protein [Gemmatimonadaceae bacterium]|nr:sulfite exporter TauE/SafE family protein [Gemmatimonadaceae bacterium]